MEEFKEPIVIVAGTRPEIIKLTPVIENLEKLNIDYLLVWSGQHYDYELCKIFFEEFKIPEPHINLNVGSGTHAEEVAKTMLRLEKVLIKHKPSIVIAEGDTNTVVATALTASKLNIPFAHIEAGLRSYDMTMPEEINRKIADAISDICFAPTELAAINLMHEGIPRNRIYVTGNTIIDVVLKYKDKAYKKGLELINKLNLEQQNYLLVTVHRQENTDNSERLLRIFKALKKLSEYYPVIIPIHPRTLSRLKEYGFYEKLSNTKNFLMLKPLGYSSFLGLLMHARVVLTDSGGVQEEAFTLKVPTITLRYNTERPETVLLGANTLVGAEYQEIVNQTLKKATKYHEIRKRLEKVPNPLGDGRAGIRIAKILSNIIEKTEVKEFDSRDDPFITYTIVDNITNIDERYVVSYYNEEVATLNKKQAKKALIRAPLSYIRKLIRILKNIDTGTAHTK